MSSKYMYWMFCSSWRAQWWIIEVLLPAWQALNTDDAVLVLCCAEVLKSDCVYNLPPQSGSRIQTAKHQPVFGYNYSFGFLYGLVLDKACTVKKSTWRVSSVYFSRTRLETPIEKTLKCWRNGTRKNSVSSSCCYSVGSSVTQNAHVDAVR